MKFARLWLVTALCAVLLLLAGVALFESPIRAQTATNTPRPGIQTLSTVARTAPASDATAVSTEATGTIAQSTAASSTATVTTTAGIATPANTPAPGSARVSPGAPVTRSLALTNTLIPAPGAVGGGVGTITVVGEGRVTIQPDIARITLGVDAVQPTVKQASTEARQTMDAVVKAVKAQGVADKDIQTASFNIYVERTRPNDNPTGPEEVRYHVNNSVNVVVRDLDKVSNVLDGAIEAGANNVYGVNFSVENTAEVEAQAREAAVTDAQRRAQDLARLNGVSVGNVIAISEVIGYGGGGQVSNSIRDAVPMAMGGGGGSVNPGELELRMQLQITYAMQ
jgi:uncharacterized protein